MPYQPGKTVLLTLCLSCVPPAAAAEDGPAESADLAARAVMQLQCSDWEGAAQTYERITRHNPYRADHWHNYGYALHKAGRHASAIRAWERALDLGFAWDPLWERGIVCDATWVKAFGPGTPVPLYNIARAEARLGNKAGAIRAIERAMDQGFAVEEGLRDEADFAPLHADPHFRSLAAMPPIGDVTRDDRWRYDLDYLARRIVQVHEPADGRFPRGRIQDAIAVLRRRVTELPDGWILVELQRIAAMAGSAHTRLSWPNDLARYPVEFYLYKDGLFVRRAAPAHARAVGARVLRIAGRTADELLESVRPLCSIDGPMGVKVEAPALLARPEVFGALKLAPNPGSIAVVVERPGATPIEMELAPERVPDSASRGWTAVGTDAAKARAPSFDVENPFYWFRHLPADNLVYFQYNAVGNRPDEDLATFCRRMMRFVRERAVQHLVIDLRRNGGGNGLLNRALTHELIRDDTISRRGHLFVIIGRGTFSAAVSAASDLERHTDAIFVGEPTRSGPNGIGQATVLRLPCSRVEISCASLRIQGGVLSSDRRPWIAPDVVAEETSADAAAFRDPALEAIRSIIHRGHGAPHEPRAAPASTATGRPALLTNANSRDLARAPEANLGREPVEFRSGDNVLKGDLLTPKHGRPHAAIAFVHGSGSLARDDSTLHPALRLHLARLGVASLCWDKPGVGASSGDWTKQRFEDRAQEAIDAIEFLRHRPEIDPKRLGLWGISQGGWICPLAATRSPNIAFVILVSAPAGTIEEQDLYRIECQMRADRVPESDVEKALHFARRRIALVREGSFEQFDAAQRAVGNARWFRDYVHRLGPGDFRFAKLNIDYDGRMALSKVPCPVLVIVGGRDTVVPARQGAAIIADALHAAGNRDVTIKTIPGADHFMRPEASGSAKGEAALPPDGPLATEYFEAIAEWLAPRVKPAP